MNQKIVNCPQCGKILPKDLWGEKSSINQKTVKCPRCDKLLSQDLWEKQKPTNNRTVKCPWCGSTKNWKDGKRKVPSGDIQRYFCRECAFRFSYSN